MRKIKRAAILLGFMISLFCMAVPCKAASSAAYKKYVQNTMKPSLGKASTGTKTGGDIFGWCSNSGILATYAEDFNGDGKTEAVVVYLKKTQQASRSSRTDVHLAVLSDKNGKVYKSQDLPVVSIDGFVGADCRIYVKAYGGKKYLVIQSVGAIDNSGCGIFVLNMNKNGRLSGTVYWGETCAGWLTLNRAAVSASASSLKSFGYSSGTRLYDKFADMTAKEYGQLLSSGLKKYGLSVGLSKVYYGTKMWNLKENSNMSLVCSIKSTYVYQTHARTTVYQGVDHYKKDSSNSSSKKTIKIKLNKTSATLYMNGTKTVKLKATVTGSKDKVTWSSSDKTVAVVSSSGKVTAKKAGTATITAKVNNKKASCKIMVKNKPASKKVAKVTVSQSSAAQGKNYVFSGKDQSGKTLWTYKLFVHFAPQYTLMGYKEFKNYVYIIADKYFIELNRTTGKEIVKTEISDYNVTGMTMCVDSKGTLYVFSDESFYLYKISKEGKLLWKDYIDANESGLNKLVIKNGKLYLYFSMSDNVITHRL